MTRKDARAAAVQLLYEFEFHRDENPVSFFDFSQQQFEAEFDAYTARLFFGVLEHGREIDEIIAAHSQNWRLARINKIRIVGRSAGRVI